MRYLQSNFLSWFSQIFLFCFLFILDISFLPILPKPFNMPHLLLDAALFLTIIFNLKTAIKWAGAAGLLLDITGAMPAGAHLIAFLAAVGGINFFLRRIFTSRSLYSVIILGIMGQLIYALSLTGFLSFYKLVKALPFSPLSINGEWSFFLTQIVVNLLLIIFSFFITRRLNKRLKSVFLVK